MLSGEQGFISVKGVSKQYSLRGPLGYFKSKLGLADKQDCFWALRDVNFTVEAGQAYGIVGRNGSGKSTMLKILAGILSPTSGEVRIQGRLACLIEVGAGFHPELTGRENIYLHGAISGMRRNEVRENIDSIIQYAEIEKFIDLPVKNYSSGMFTRLGFSVAVHSRPGVLLVDEVLAVGDQAFQTKCLKTIRELMASGTAVIVVSHNLFTVANLCTRGLWLNLGTCMAEGAIDEVVTAYDRSSQQSASTSESGTVDPGDAVVKLSTVELVNRDGEKAQVQQGKPWHLRAELHSSAEIIRPVLCCALLDSDGRPIAATNTRVENVELSPLFGSAALNLEIQPPRLLPGQYTVNLMVCDEWQSTCYASRNVQVEVKTEIPNLTREFYGDFLLSTRWDVSPQPN